MCMRLSEKVELSSRPRADGVPFAVSFSVIIRGFANNRVRALLARE